MVLPSASSFQERGGGEFVCSKQLLFVNTPFFPPKKKKKKKEEKEKEKEKSNDHNLEGVL